jgi:hypothetical protein
MHFSRIRLHFTDKDLPTQEKDPAGESEIDQFASGRGLNYAAVARRASRVHGCFSSQSFWKAGSARKGSQIGSSFKKAGVMGTGA